MEMPAKLRPGDLFANTEDNSLGEIYVWLAVDTPEGLSWVYIAAITKGTRNNRFDGDVYTGDAHDPNKEFEGQWDSLTYLGNLCNGVDWEKIVSREAAKK